MKRWLLVGIVAVAFLAVFVVMKRPKAKPKYDPIFIKNELEEPFASLGEVVLFGSDFNAAFALDTECNGLVLVRDDSKGNPVGWSDENGYWWVSGYTGHQGTKEEYFNWGLYRRGQTFAKDGKTSAEAVHQICIIVKGKGGNIQ